MITLVRYDMNKKLFFIVSLFFAGLYLSGQDIKNKIIYVIDSIPVIKDPAVGNEINESDIADITVVRNKDSLQLLGYASFDGAIFIFTKEYRKRSLELKQIPSSLRMVKKGGIWHYLGNPYSGKFIDYYYNGKKEGEGSFLNGKVEGTRRTYYQNGNLSREVNYSNGIENGMDVEYHEDGSLSQKGTFVNGKEEGIWEKYFPNGQVKQRSIFKNGVMDGETTVYYSTGKVLAIEVNRNGKSIPDKRLDKIEQAMSKGHTANREQDYKAAIKYYSKAIELDTMYAEAYFARGTVKLNAFQFDEAVIDLDKALLLEPYFDKALSNRAFARIRKYQFGSSRKLSESSGVTVMASKDRPDIPAAEQAIICSDLQRAIFLGDKGKMIMEAFQQFCGSK